MKIPKPPMVGALEIAVIPERIAHRDIEISLGPPRQCVEALMHMATRHSPRESLGMQVGSLDHSVRNQIQGAHREYIQVVAAKFDVVDPGVRRELEQQLLWEVPAILSRLVNE